MMAQLTDKFKSEEIHVIEKMVKLLADDIEYYKTINQFETVHVLKSLKKDYEEIIEKGLRK